MTNQQHTLSENPINLQDKDKHLQEGAKLKIFIIGIGNAGNQVLNIAYDRGYPNVFAVNTSFKDLKSSQVNDGIKSYLIGNDARGAGKDRDYAKSLFTNPKDTNNGQDLFTNIPKFTEYCNIADIIIVTGSTAGGTGSALAPLMLNVLSKKYPQKICMYYGIIPKKTEYLRSQLNSIECLNEIKKLNIPYLLADLDHYQDIPTSEAYSNIGSHIVDNIDIINGKYLYDSIHGMIDENDMRTVISESGYMSIYNVNNITQNDIDKESVQSMMVKKIKNSPAAPIMRDKIVRQIAVINNMPDDLMDDTRSANYNELTDYVGRPKGDVFQNYSIISASKGQFIVILSGQTFPNSRVSAMQEIIDKDREVFDKVKDVDLSSQVEENSIMKSGKKAWQESTSSDDIDINDIFANL